MLGIAVLTLGVTPGPRNRRCTEQVAHAAARVGHVAAKARNQVHVQEHHGLTGHETGVDADV
jgi:hypothetical protein